MPVTLLLAAEAAGVLQRALHRQIEMGNLQEAKILSAEIIEINHAFCKRNREILGLRTDMEAAKNVLDEPRQQNETQSECINRLHDTEN